MKAIQPLLPNKTDLSDFDFVEHWLEHCKTNDDASEATITAYRTSIDVWIDWLASKRHSAPVTPQDVSAFKEWLKKHYSAQTANIRLTAVRSFYAWMVNTGRLPISPAANVKGVKRAKSRMHKRDALTDVEVERVLATCDATPEGLRDKAIIALKAYCALRDIEIHRANLDSLRTQAERMVLVVHGKGHSEADRIVVIPVDKELLVRDWLHARAKVAGLDKNEPLFVSLSRRSLGQRLSLSAIRRMAKARFAEAGVVGDTKTSHSLRHSAITNAIRHGATPLQVQEMAGHTSFDTTLIYYHETDRLSNPAEDLIDYGSQRARDIDQNA
jgi:site-specific recombinase XerD